MTDHELPDLAEMARALVFEPEFVLTSGRWDFMSETGSSGIRRVKKLYGRHDGPEATATILIDGRLFRRQMLKGDGERGQLQLALKPSFLKAIPPRTRIEVLVGGGRLPHASGEPFALLDGTGKPGQLAKMLSRGYYMSKKGSLMRPLAARPAAQRATLKAVAGLDADLRAGFGYPLWLAHGTLLGLIRDGGFLERDDDFDTAYLSQVTTVQDACAERLEIARFLLGRGWDIELTAPSGLLRLRLKGSSIDIMPGWIQDGKFFCLAYTMLDLDRSDILPVASGRLIGRKVTLPRKPELFLEQKYGPGWSSPDPSYVARRPEGSLEILSRGFLSTSEADGLNRSLQADLETAKTGRRRHLLYVTRPGPGLKHYRALKSRFPIAAVISPKLKSGSQSFGTLPVIGLKDYVPESRDRVILGVEPAEVEATISALRRCGLGRSRIILPEGPESGSAAGFGDPDLHRLGTAVMHWLARDLNGSGLRYFAAASTLRGLAGTHGLLPTESGIEIVLPVEDFDRLDQLVTAALPELERDLGVRARMRVDRYTTGKGPWEPGQPRALGVALKRNGRSMSVTFLPMYRTGDQMLCRWKSRSVRYPARHFEGAQFLAFDGHPIRVPLDHEALLTRIYGDWRQGLADPAPAGGDGVPASADDSPPPDGADPAQGSAPTRAPGAERSLSEPAAAAEAPSPPVAIGSGPPEAAAADDPGADPVPKRPRGTSLGSLSPDERQALAASTRDIRNWSEYLSFRSFFSGFPVESPVLPVCRTVDEIREAIATQVAGLDRPAILLSGGMDSAVIAPFLPRGTLAYTLYHPALKVNELDLARSYCERFGLVHVPVAVDGDDYLSVVDRLMISKRMPLSPAEPLFHIAARRAVADGHATILTAGGVDGRHGGFQRLRQFIAPADFASLWQKYYLPPSRVLRVFTDIGHVLRDYVVTHDGERVIDANRFMVEVGTERFAYDNAISAAGGTHLSPFSKFATEFDLQRNAVEPKYLIQDLYRQIYGVNPPKKLGMQKPTYLLSDFRLDNRDVFFETANLAEMKYQRRVLIYFLDRFITLQRQGKIDG